MMCPTSITKINDFQPNIFIKLRSSHSRKFSLIFPRGRLFSFNFLIFFFTFSFFFLGSWLIRLFFRQELLNKSFSFLRIHIFNIITKLFELFIFLSLFLFLFSLSLLIHFLSVIFTLLFRFLTTVMILIYLISVICSLTCSLTRPINNFNTMCNLIILYSVSILLSSRELPLLNNLPNLLFCETEKDIFRFKISMDNSTDSMEII